MIVGIGADIVNVARFFSWVKNAGLLERFFHSEEVAYIKKSGGAQTIAGRFAAKEAFVKALGTGFCGISLKNICTVNDQAGKPHMHLFDNAQKAFTASGAQKLHLSISHEKDYACAFVLLERL